MKDILCRSNVVHKNGETNATTYYFGDIFATLVTSQISERAVSLSLKRSLYIKHDFIKCDVLSKILVDFLVNAVVAGLVSDFLNVWTNINPVYLIQSSERSPLDFRVGV